MITFFTAWMVFATITLLWCAWSLACNSKTYSQRQKLLAALHGSRALRQRYDWPDLAEYSSHRRALQFCRDPLALYPEDLIAAAFPASITQKVES